MNEKSKRNRDAPFAAEIDRQVQRIVGASKDQDEKTKITMIAADAGCTTAELYQWRTGRRPVPPERARALAAAINSQPELVSRRYAEGFAPAPVHPDADDIESLRLAMNLLSSVMAVHRPVEAREAAATMRRNVDKRLLKRGSYLRALIQTLEGGGAQAEAGKEASG
jgi:hypothetical protein